MIKKKTKEPRALPRDTVMLDDLINECYTQLLKQVAKDAKLGDFLKMIEMRAKLTPGESEQKKFWEMLDKIRTKTFAEMESSEKRAPRATKTPSAKKGKK